MPKLIFTELYNSYLLLNSFAQLINNLVISPLKWKKDQLTFTYISISNSNSMKQ